MNGQKQTESIDWKIGELMILIASVHDFNFSLENRSIGKKRKRNVIYQVKSCLKVFK